ncbi:MAG: hypothetical protein WDA09_08790 [Bacteriovoracaceae bacterium]
MRLIINENTNLESLNLDSLILGKAELKTLNAGYEELKMDSPDWVLIQLSAIDAEINRRTRDELMRRLKAAEARQAALRTRKEMRESVDAEINELRKRLTQ